jgi:hypothetical protein
VLAGNGLTGGGALNADVTLDVGVSGLGLSAGAGAVILTSSSAPGAAASILASDSSGFLTLEKLNTPLLATTSGNLTLDAAGDQVTIGASNNLRTANYGSQTVGWALDYNGSLDARYIYTDEMHAKSFIADLEQALAGGQIIAKSVALLSRPFTAPAAGGQTALWVRDLPSAADMQVFEPGDIVRVRTFSRSAGSLTIADCWGVVSNPSTAGSGEQSWTFDRSTSTRAGTMTAGTVVAADSIVLDYGTTGNGFHEVNAIDGAYGLNSPYSQVVTWTTHPQDGQAVRVRTGNLLGITGVAEFGLWAGAVAAGNVKITGDAVQLRQGTSAVISLNSDGSSRFDGPMALGTDGGIYQGSGSFASPTTGLKIWRQDGVGRIAGYNAGSAQWYANTDGRLYAGGGAVKLDADGVSITQASSSTPWTATSTIKFNTAGGTFLGGLEFRTATSVNHWSLGFDGSLPRVRASSGATGNILWLDSGAAAYVKVEENSTSTVGTITLSADTIATSGAATFSGVVTLIGSSPELNVGSATNLSTGDSAVNIGYGRTGSGNSYIDLIGDTTYTDYGARLIRNSGVNGLTDFVARGTGGLRFRVVEAGDLTLSTSNTARLVISSTGDVDISEKVRAKAIVLDLTSSGSGTTGTTTFTGETYGSVSGSGTAVRLASASGATTNAGWVKFYIGTTVCWYPYWTNIG